MRNPPVIGVEQDVVLADGDGDPGFTSASEGYPSGGVGGRPPTPNSPPRRQDAATPNPGFTSASEGYPAGGLGGRHPRRYGATVWFTGLPSAGKATIAHA